MTNGVLEAALRDELVRELEQLNRIANEGNEDSVLWMGRHDVPRMTASLLALVEMHRQNADGRCSRCRRFRWLSWPRTCQMLLTVRLAWTSR
ncbi:hypothetical protein [Lentzea xinjiangensis]|uniref:hypothetical protein n=1 Tax=Lentzea xinjiangensis TaxID=402600 RepID=UPI000B7E3240|nr:hypothetical protein [Lentzea xinjiangensis]